jgi:hypothetical protein
MRVESVQIYRRLWGAPAFDVGGKLDFAAIRERRRRWHDEATRRSSGAA